MMPFLNRFFQKKMKCLVKFEENKLIIFDGYGRNINIDIFSIDKIYFSEIDRYVYFEDYYVFICNDKNYYLPSSYDGCENILNELKKSGLNISKNIEDIPANSQLGFNYNLYDKDIDGFNIKF